MSSVVLDFAFNQYMRLTNQIESMQRAVEEGFCVTHEEYNAIVQRKNRVIDFIEKNGGLF